MNKYIIFLILLLLFTENSLAYSSFVSVSISSIPPGANIYINGEYKGRTPVTINLPEGSYSIKMSLTGYKGIISDFNIVSDMVRQEINATFEPISPNTIVPISTITTVEITPLQSAITVKDIGIDKELNKHIVLVNINSKIGQLIYMEEYYSTNGAGNLKLDSRIIYYNNTIKNNELTLKIKRPLDKNGEYRYIKAVVYIDNKMQFNSWLKYSDSNPVSDAQSTNSHVADNFRIGPTINLRPVKDDISKSEDGLIELYIDNPSVNDVVMNTDIRISVPSGISIYGQGFGDAGSAGVVHGAFDIAPGKSRTIQITIKAERTGEFLIKFSGLYWPGNNKDAFEPISLTHNFKVHDPIIVTITPNTIGGFEVIFGICILMISYLFFKK